MKTFIKQTAVLTLTAVFLVTATFAKPLQANFEEAQYIENFNGGVPATVLDPNFNQWMPPQPVPMVSANINDIMMTDGRVIYYNPMIVSQVPPKIAAFFLAHEYGHIYGQTSSEYYSDQFAARVYSETDMSVVKSAIWHFANIQGNMCDQSHGCGWQRALNIGQTAGFSDEQIQEIVRGNF